MTEKLRRTAIVVAVLAGSYLGLIVLYWLVMNLRLFTAPMALLPFGFVGLIALVVFLFVLLVNLVPPIALRRMQIGRMWPYLLTSIPSIVLFVTLFMVTYSLEDNLGAILPRGPGGVVVPDVMVLTPMEFVRWFAREFENQFLNSRNLTDPLRWEAVCSLALVAIPGAIGSSLYWLFAVRRKNDALK